MKRIIYLLICITFFSCEKESEKAGSGSGTMEYKLNNTHFSFPGATVKKIQGIPGATSTTYLIQGFDNKNNSANIFIFTQTDTLKQQSYHLVYGSAPAFTVGNKGFTVMDPPEYFVDVTISSYKDGRISGTFSGKVMHIISVTPEVVEKANIIEGKLTNIPVIYY